MNRLAAAAFASAALFATPLLAQDAASDSTDQAAPMEVMMMAPDGSERGTVTITSTPNGLLLDAELSGFESGTHAFHIHETGTCEGDFTSAGGHYNPTDKEHGYMAENGPHAGDMPNFSTSEDGAATFSAFNPMVSLSGGDAPLDDDDGSALLVHGGADDYMSQPAGDAGDRVACGVIFAAE